MHKSYEDLNRELTQLREGLVIPGIYQHYKGPLYQLIDVGFEESSSRPVAWYHPLEWPKIRWSRPLLEFTGMVEIQGATIRRFALVTPPDDLQGHE